VDTEDLRSPSLDWQRDYAQSPKWRDLLQATQDPFVAWPTGVRLHLRQMILDGRVCVPETRGEEIILLHHRATGHVGVKRLVSDLTRRYIWPDPTKVQELAQKVRRECVV
jgi:hypothetical protein